MPSYVGFLRNPVQAYTGLSPDEAQRTLDEYLAWNAEREQAGTPVGGGGLSRSGRVLRLAGGEPASTDGPHTESNEIVGGYLVLEAADLDEAEKIFGSHPHLAIGSIEVRAIGEQGCTD
ncbi:YciI family protein [Amycolatopsis aidingensis]|uniref:YciI family protein n=1 Tax=Amycolatopsis aidingensis TaxID=2842453 RepID=UPI001C0AA4CC|nr:YciI family protein [Amycolatopsis aidingensis]